MKIKGRLINKEKPTLIITKNKMLKVGRYYRLRFIGNERNDILTPILTNFNNDFYCFKFVQKVMGAFKLKYQNDYKIEVKEAKDLNEKYTRGYIAKHR